MSRDGETSTEFKAAMAAVADLQPHARHVMHPKLLRRCSKSELVRMIEELRTDLLDAQESARRGES
jgi:hypothetical protein